MRTGHTKKILYIDSYHEEFIWSRDVTAGIRSVLDPREHIELKIFRMDTKRNKSEKDKKAAAHTARELIESWRPDVVIASDDNASKYLVAPYYKNAGIPVVFCGVNWNADIYGFPADSITGIVEVNLVLETIEMLKQYAKGERIGYIGDNLFSEEKELDHFRNVLHIPFADGGLVADFEEWKDTYLRLQETVDMIVLLTPNGIEGWSDSAASSFILKNTVIPTGGIADNNVRYALLGKVKIAEEQDGGRAARP